MSAQPTFDPRSSRHTTRGSIGAVAAKLFGEHGYEGASVRAIAAAAGVDPALVMRYYGSKEDLFLETIELHPIFDVALESPVHELGESLVRAVVQLRGTRALKVYAALVRASGHAKVQKRLRTSTQQSFVEPLTARLEGPGREVRARLVTAQILGLLEALALRDDEVLLQAPADTLVREYVSAVNALIIQT